MQQRLKLPKKKLQKSVFNISVRLVSLFSIDLDEDNKVTKIADGSSVMDAGLQLGDKIIRVNGVDIQSKRDIARACSGKETVELTLRRNNEEKEEKKEKKTQDSTTDTIENLLKSYESNQTHLIKQRNQQKRRSVMNLQQRLRARQRIRARRWLGGWRQRRRTHHP